MSRGCLSLLPPDLAEVTGVGPRRGPLSRPGYEIAEDAAGFAFPHGEHEPRAGTVDQLQRRRKNPLASFDTSDAADVLGNGSPRIELRALSIDTILRRAKSEPPGRICLDTDKEFARRAFSVLLDVDNLGSRRRVPSPICQSTRADLARWAILLSDIDHVLSRKHFSEPPDGSAQSPRQLAACIDDIDIDAHFGRKHFPEQPTSMHGEVVPWASENWEISKAPFPKKGNRRFFKQSKWSDQFGPLIASQIDYRKHSQDLETQCLMDLEQGWNKLRRTSGSKVSPLSKEKLAQILQAPRLPHSARLTPQSSSGTSSSVPTPLLSARASLGDTPESKATITTTASSPMHSARSDIEDEKLSNIANQLLADDDAIEPPRTFHRVIRSMISASEVELFKQDHLGRRLKGLMRAEKKNLQSYPRVRDSLNGVRKKPTYPISQIA